MELVSMNWVAVLCGMSILDEVLSDSNRYANETLYSSNATIYSMAFSEDNKFLASSSSTGTIHIFRLPTEEEKLAKKNDVIWKFLYSYFTFYVSQSSE